MWIIYQADDSHEISIFVFEKKTKKKQTQICRLLQLNESVKTQIHLGRKEPQYFWTTLHRKNAIHWHKEF